MSTSRLYISFISREKHWMMWLCPISSLGRHLLLKKHLYTDLVILWCKFKTGMELISQSAHLCHNQPSHLLTLKVPDYITNRFRTQYTSLIFPTFLPHEILLICIISELWEAGVKRLHRTHTVLASSTRRPTQGLSLLSGSMLEHLAVWVSIFPPRRTCPQQSTRERKQISSSEVFEMNANNGGFVNKHLVSRHYLLFDTISAV